MDEVYNLAANMGGIGFITEIGAEVMHDNVLINTLMLEAARKNKVKRYLYTSSACVYPTYRQTNPELVGLKEEDAYPADPDNFYGWEKLFTEKLCEAYQRDYGMTIRVLRYHNIYGPEGTYKGGREKSPAAICRKVAEATNPGTIDIWGDGKQTRSYCYIDDAVKATILLMESDYEKPINIGSDRLVSINELADMVINISGKKITKVYNHSAPQGVRGRNADLTLVKKMLHWKPQVSLEDGLAKTYCWINKQIFGELEPEPFATAYVGNRLDFTLNGISSMSPVEYRQADIFFFFLPTELFIRISKKVTNSLLLSQYYFYSHF